MRIYEEKLVWPAFCERKSEEIERGGRYPEREKFYRCIKRERKFLAIKFFFIHSHNETVSE